MRILVDTNILVHAHNKASKYCESASNLLKKALMKEFEACLSYQNILEFYSIITDPKCVERPLPLREAERICGLYLEAEEIEKLNFTETTISETLKFASQLGIRGAGIFDCFLAVTAKHNDVRKMYTENIIDFKKFDFLEVEFPIR